MGMVVQHNLQAMNANRMLSTTSKAQAKSTEKLSSGYKINRAADDAAGLSISEKMRKQIRGLTKASSNAQDGISSVQTAEGALTEVHSMLQRMNELATQASNGTNSENDRQSIQDEIDQLVTEIDRVAETTKFNEIYLLKGNKEGTKSQMTVAAHDAGLAGKLIDEGNTAKFTIDSKLEDGDKVSIAGQEYTIGKVNKGVDSTDGYIKVGDTAITNAAVNAGDSIKDASTGINYTLVNKATLAQVGATGSAAQYKFTTEKSAIKIEYADGTVDKYDIDDNGGLDKLSVKDAEEIVKDSLAKGAKVTLTKDKDVKDCDIEIVNSLTTTGKEREISITAPTAATVTAFATAAGVTLAADDTVTLSGKETVLTANTPKTSTDISNVVKEMVVGDQMNITRNGGTAKTITIEKETDEVNNQYTAEDALKLLQDGDQVEFKIQATNSEGVMALATAGITNSTALPTAANIVTMIGSTKANETDSSVITKEEALTKMADELAKASSIGTDTAAIVKNNGDGTFEITKGSVEVKDALSFSLHVGADADMTNKINVDIEAMSAAGLGIKGINVKDDTGVAGTYAIDAIADAISKVSAQRSALGAVQNRLEHTISNLDNVVENTTSAESQIRDTDMAKEMVEYSKNNILAQAGQSMLAQANQSNQGVLSLLG